MIPSDRTMKFALIWIAAMLTILAVDKIVHIPFAIAQETGASSTKIVLNEPIEVIIREPVETEITSWSAYPSPAIKVKIDDPWPAKIEIEDEVRVTGQLQLRD
ncbi:hypothetical protein JXB22_05425 [candidate division WOR-3 bacterium]|nr:hypothetical protein [candidate division WOR-3 bacterium]